MFGLIKDVLTTMILALVVYWLLQFLGFMKPIQEAMAQTAPIIKQTDMKDSKNEMKDSKNDMKDSKNDMKDSKKEIEAPKENFVGDMFLMKNINEAPIDTTTQTGPANFSSNALRVDDNYTREFDESAIEYQGFLPYINESIENGGEWKDIKITGYTEDPQYRSDFSSPNWKSAGLENKLVLPNGYWLKHGIKDERLGMESDRHPVQEFPISPGRFP